jgi:hypothetical protein
MVRRDKRRAKEPGRGISAASRAFLRLSEEGTAELDEHSRRKGVVALAMAALILLAVPLYWATGAFGSGGDEPVAVKSNSGPGSDEEEEDDSSGPGSDGDDDTPTDGETATGTTPNTGTSATGTANTATGTVTVPEGDQPGDDGAAETATGTTQGTGPSDTNTRNTDTGTKTKQD